MGRELHNYSNNFRGPEDAEVAGGAAVKGGRPCLPRETAGTLQWGGFNCWNNDRYVLDRALQR